MKIKTKYLGKGNEWINLVSNFRVWTRFMSNLFTCTYNFVHFVKAEFGPWFWTISIVKLNWKPVYLGPSRDEMMGNLQMKNSFFKFAFIWSRIKRYLQKKQKKNRNNESSKICVEYDTIKLQCLKNVFIYCWTKILCQN